MRGGVLPRTMADALTLIPPYFFKALHRFMWILKIEPTRLAPRGKSPRTEIGTLIKAR